MAGRRSISAMLSRNEHYEPKPPGPEEKEKRVSVETRQALVRYPMLWGGVISQLAVIFAEKEAKACAGSYAHQDATPALVFRKALQYFISSGEAERLAREAGDKELLKNIADFKRYTKD